MNGYSTQRKQLSYSARSAAGMERLLGEVEELKVCEGVNTDDSSSYRIRAKNCLVLTSRPICPNCLRHRRKMRLQRPATATVKELKIKNLRRMLLRATAAREKQKKKNHGTERKDRNNLRGVPEQAA